MFLFSKNCASFTYIDFVLFSIEEVAPVEEKSPANLLDNLFRKTKTTPCLYWLPLGSEMVSLLLEFLARR